MKAQVFVGCSTENLTLAYAVQEELEYDAEVTLWPQGFFQPSRYPIEDLVGSLHRFDFAVFLFTPDDTLKIRRKPASAVRDNVLLELGLFLGQLGRERCYLIAPRQRATLRLPTDLLGMTVLSYDAKRADGNMRAAVGPACNAIRVGMADRGLLQRFPLATSAPAQTRSKAVEQRRRRTERALNTILSSSSDAGTPASLAFFHVDRFSSLNKWYGSEVCDQVITVVEREINQMLPQHFEERIGGDEFLICLKGETLAQAARMAGNVVARIKNHNWATVAPNLYCTISAGVAHHNRGRPVQDWIVRAIQGAVDAKKSDGNRVSKGPLSMPAYLSLAYEVMLSQD